MSRMLGIAAVAMALAALALVLARSRGADGDQAADARLDAVRSFAFAIGTGDLAGNPAAVADRYAAYDLVIVDGEEVTRVEVRALRGVGAVVLGYLSVGTIEPYRSWYPLLRPYRLPTKFEEFGEWYARVNAPGFRRAIAHSIAPRLLARGLDGLFLDNTDMIETHRRQKPGMRKLVRALSARVHRGGRRILFSQNGEAVIGPMLRHYDGWNREDVTSTYDFESHRYELVPDADRLRAMRALRRMREQHGLLTLATDYVAAGDGATTELALRNACSVGALSFASNIGLTRIPAQPPACPEAQPPAP